MASNYDPSLNLATILQSLSSHTQQAPQLSLQSDSDLGYQAYHNQASCQHYSQIAQQPPHYHQTQSISTTPYVINNAKVDNVTPSNQRQEKIPPRSESHAVETDPRSLIEWSKGLRFVNKLASQNPSFASQVQKMIANQLKHEKEWWNGRQALIEQQSARAEGSRKIQDVLRAIGGDTSSASDVQSPEEVKEELKTFDKKVHKASQNMAKAINVELKALSVPFFDVRPDLVLTSSEALSESDREALSSSLKIEEKQLLELQRRILQYLEDMYKP